MDKKKIYIGIVLLLACGVFFGIRQKYNSPSAVNESEKVQPAEKSIKKQKVKQTKQTALIKEKSVNQSNVKEEEPAKQIRHANLYNSSVFIPLSAITEIADLPEDIQAKIKAYTDNSTNIFMLKRKKDKVLLITEDLENIRHGIDFVEISIPSGHQTVSTLGYNGKIQDSENDIWEYNENKLPTKHTKYNKDGHIEFTETWNYSSLEPVKYEMKNAEGKTLSIRKETVTDGSNMRVEHLTYDTHGNTKTNVSATYEGADVKRFTYYNADKPSDGMSIFSEYEDGMKVKETVYTSDLKVKNVYESSYSNGERENITVFDDKNVKQETFEK